MKRIIVSQIGPVDRHYRPLLSTTSNDHQMELDRINNDTELFSQNLHKLREERRNRWNVTDCIEPYFMTKHDKSNQLWVKGCTLKTKQNAKNTIIYDAIKELEIGDKIQIKRKQTGDRRWYFRDDDHDRDSNHIDEGTGIICDITLNGRKLTLLMNGDIQHIYCRKYDIIRDHRRKQSNLYSIRADPEIHLIAQFLKSILPSQPWLNIIEIARFLGYKYERNVYFDYKKFEEMVSASYHNTIQTEEEIIIHSEKSCIRCTYLNPIQNERCSMCDHPFKLVKDHKNATDSDWLEQDLCYEQRIHDLAHRGHPVFPSIEQKNKLYHKKPFLANIPNEERIYLKTIKRRISAVMRESTNLYKYQLHTVLWCYMMEQAIAANCKLCVGSNDLRFTNDSNIECNVYCIHNKKFVPSNIPHVLPPRLLGFKGGILADDVGLGKTLTVLSLIASDDRSMRNEDKNDRIETELGPNGKSVKSAATLLMVPARLIEQWKLEINKHFAEDTFNVVAVMTSTEHRKVSYRTLLTADIVLVAHEFLRHRDAGNIDEHWNKLDPSLPPEPTEKRYNLRSKPTEKYQDLYQLNPFFELIHWKRVVIDEAHETYNNRWMVDLSSDYNWYVSATPFPNERCMAFAADFLGINFDDKYYPKVSWYYNINKPLGFVLDSIFYHHLFSRHTTDSILDDNYLPQIEQNVQFVDLHPIERLFYELAPIRNHEVNKLKRRICCGVYKDFHLEDDVDIDRYEHYLKHIFMQNKRNVLKQIHSTQKGLKKEIRDLRLLKKYRNDIIRKKDEFEENGESFTLRNAFPRCFKRYENIAVRLKASKYRMSKMESQIPRYKMEYELMEKYGVLEQMDEFEKKFEDQQLIEIVTKYGSKQAVILKFIKTLHENEKNHIIIFSSFNETLNQMKERLCQIGLHSVICRGTVYTQRKAIRDFKNIRLRLKPQRSRIILLSVEDKASGTDLNCATHVVLVDPVPGSCSESFAAERQAIGRAMRQGMKQEDSTRCTKVIRFVVKDSIEHETYKRNMKMREKLMKNIKEKEDDDDAKCFKGKRTESQIEFYMKINDENVNVLNVNRKRKMCDDGSDQQRSIKRRKVM